MVRGLNLYVIKERIHCFLIGMLVVILLNAVAMVVMGNQAQNLVTETIYVRRGYLINIFCISICPNNSLTCLFVMFYVYPVRVRT